MPVLLRFNHKGYSADGAQGVFLGGAARTGRNGIGGAPRGKWGRGRKPRWAHLTV